MKQEKTIRKSLERGRNAFEIMVTQNHKRLLSYALALVKEEWLAEEIVQDAFITAYENLHKFDRSRDFGSWMRGIIRNKYLESMRSKKEQVLEEPVLDMMEKFHKEIGESEKTGKHSSLTALKKCLETLNKAMKRTVDLFYFKNKPSCEVAEMTDTSDANVRKRLERAREYLGECIEDKLGLSQEGIE